METFNGKKAEDILDDVRKEIELRLDNSEKELNLIITNPWEENQQGLVEIITRLGLFPQNYKGVLGSDARVNFNGDYSHHKGVFTRKGGTSFLWVEDLYLNLETFLNLSERNIEPFIDIDNVITTRGENPITFMTKKFIIGGTGFLNNKINSLVDSVETNLTEINNHVNGLTNFLFNDVVEGQNGFLNFLQSEIDEISKRANFTFQDVEREISSQMQNTENKIYDSLSTLFDNVSRQVNSGLSELEQNISANTEYINREIDNISTIINNSIDNVNDRITQEITEIELTLSNDIQPLINDLLLSDTQIRQRLNNFIEKDSLEQHDVIKNLVHSINGSFTELKEEIDNKTVELHKNVNSIDNSIVDFLSSSKGILSLLFNDIPNISPDLKNLWKQLLFWLLK